LLFDLKRTVFDTYKYYQRREEEEKRKKEGLLPEEEKHTCYQFY